MLKPLGDRVVLKIEEKNKPLGALSLQAQPKKKPKQLKLWLLDKVFVP